jgi:mevalonate kinase
MKDICSPWNKKITNHHHDNNIRKWIHHRFYEKGIDGIMPKKHNHKQQYKFDNDMEKKIVVDITSSNPRSYGLGFSAWWSLRVLAAGILMYDLKMVDKRIHSAGIRNIFKTWNKMEKI